MQQFIHSFWGKVRLGKKRGRLLGFPTANLRLSKQIPEGVYLSKTRVNKKLFPSLTFIGKAETFGETTYKSETYILSFDEQVYNKWITVYLLEKIRSSRKFTSQEALIEQIKKDRDIAEKYFKKSNDVRG